MNKEQELKSQIYALQIQLAELECQKKQSFQKTYSLLPKRFRQLDKHTQKLKGAKIFPHNLVQALDAYSVNGTQIFELDVTEIIYDKRNKEYIIDYIEFRKFTFVQSKIILDENLLLMKKLHYQLSLKWLNNCKIICNFLELDEHKIRKWAKPRRDYSGKVIE